MRSHSGCTAAARGVSEGTAVDYAAFINIRGNVYNGSNCNNAKPLACCEAR